MEEFSKERCPFTLSLSTAKVQITIPIPWKSFSKDSCQPSPLKNQCMVVLTELMRALCFVPRGKVLRACQRMDFHQFCAVYPFARDDRQNRADRQDLKERDGFLRISLVYSRKAHQYQFQIGLDFAKAIQMFFLEECTFLARPHLRYIRYAIARHCISKVQKSHQSRSHMVHSLAQSYAETYLKQKGLACFSGDSFGIEHLAYAVQCLETPRLKQHAEFGAIVDINWEFIDENGRSSKGEIQSDWLKIIRSARLLQTSKKRLRWLHIDVQCYQVPTSDKGTKDIQAMDLYLHLQTFEEGFAVHCTLKSDMCISQVFS